MRQSPFYRWRSYPVERTLLVSQIERVDDARKLILEERLFAVVTDDERVLSDDEARTLGVEAEFAVTQVSVTCVEGPAAVERCIALADDPANAGVFVGVLRQEAYDVADGDSTRMFPQLRVLQRAIVLLKPSAQSQRREIIHELETRGLVPIARRYVKFDDLAAREFLLPHAEKPYYEDAIAELACGISLAVVFARPCAVTVLDQLMSQFAEDSLSERLPPHCVHHSRTAANCAREVQFLFPHLPADESQMGTGSHAIQHALEKYVYCARVAVGTTRPVLAEETLPSFLAGALKQLGRAQPAPGLESVRWLSQYLARLNPNRPERSDVEVGQGPLLSEGEEKMNARGQRYVVSIPVEP